MSARGSGITRNGNLNVAGQIIGLTSDTYLVHDRRVDTRFHIRRVDAVLMTPEQQREYWLACDLWVDDQEALKRRYEVQATWEDERKHRGVVHSTSDC